MTEKLREELLRVGDSVAPIHVPGDLWARGRRARRQARVLSGVVALSVIGLIFAVSMMGLPGLGGHADVAPVTTPDGAGAVPSMLYAVPERFLVDNPGTEDGSTDAALSPKVAETRLAIGRASVAFAPETMGGVSLPVVITARDGKYHPMVLPGWSGASLMAYMDSHAVALALSPDGRSLAYPWFDPKAPTDGPMPSGIRVLSLETGKIREIPLLGGDGVYAKRVSWSPDSRWLAWRGSEAKAWTRSHTSGADPVAGRIAPEATSSEPIEVHGLRESTAIAISDEGAVALYGGKRWQVWDGEVLAQGKARFAEADDTAAYSPDGTSVALSTRLDAYLEPGAGTSWFLDPTSGKLSQRPLAEGLGLYPKGADVRPLGWIDNDTVVAMVTPPDGKTAATTLSSGRYGARLVLMTAPSKPHNTWTYRMLTSYDATSSGPFAGFFAGPYVNTVTVAVDLMSLDKPTADFPRPDWPWSDERRALVIGLSIAAGLGCLLLASRVLRRRRGVLG